MNLGCYEQAQGLIYSNTCHLEPACQELCTVFSHNYVSRRCGFVETPQSAKIVGGRYGTRTELLAVARLRRELSRRGSGWNEVLFWMGLLQLELQGMRRMPQRGHDVLLYQRMDNQIRGFWGMNSFTLFLRLFNSCGLTLFQTVPVQFNHCADIQSQRKSAWK